jgi:hypothetical protein
MRITYAKGTYSQKITKRPEKIGAFGFAWSKTSGGYSGDLR